MVIVAAIEPFKVIAERLIGIWRLCKLVICVMELVLSTANAS
jgi:hypothetical protein